MDQKDVDGIANAVSRELAKLNKENADPKDSKDNPMNPNDQRPEETFICPECGNSVKANMPFCPGCGCELEWGE